MYVCLFFGRQSALKHLHIHLSECRAMYLYFLQLFLQQRARGSRLNVIIVAEGAMSRDGKQITSEQIKKARPCNLSAWFSIIGAPHE